jgi:hypothetical protein
MLKPVLTWQKESDNTYNLECGFNTVGLVSVGATHRGQYKFTVVRNHMNYSEIYHYDNNDKWSIVKAKRRAELAFLEYFSEFEFEEENQKSCALYADYEKSYQALKDRKIELSGKG